MRRAPQWGEVCRFTPVIRVTTSNGDSCGLFRMARTPSIEGENIIFLRKG
jgi:hypothetical protein